jgi:hypothetical protein
MNLRLMAVLLAASTAGMAADREFDHLVDSIESHYGIQRAHIPLMGVADFALKVAHPKGARGFKLAVFEDLKSCETCFDREELDGFIAKASEGLLHPLVRTHSRGEATYVLTGQVGTYTRMLIATFERSEATIVEVTVDFKTLLRTIDSPGRADDWVK